MKKIAITIVLVWSTVASAVPNTINFTGRLTTSTGPVTGSVNLTLKLYDVPTGGSAQWTEIHNNVGADNGLVLVDVGTLTTLDEMVLDGRRLFLEVAVGTETLAPRLALNSVPYAVRTSAATNADFLGSSIGPGDVVTSVSGIGGITANKTGNAVAVSLSTTGCSAGQVFKYNGTTFACASDQNTIYTGGVGISISGTTVSLNTTGCSTGQVFKYNGTTFACANDQDTTYAGGTGISVSGTTISLNTTGCVAGQVFKYNGTTFTCAPDDNSGGDITGVTADTGLSGGGTSGNVSLSVNTAVIQSRVTGTCSPGRSVLAINSNGTVVCNGAPTISVVPEPNVTTVNAGAWPTYANIVQSGNGLGTFTKVSAATTIIATYHGHISTVPTLPSGVQCFFQVRIDGAPGTGMGNSPGLGVFGPQSSPAIPSNISAAFTGLAAGTHTLQLFAACQGGTIGIVPNGGGFGENAQIIEF